MTLENHTRKVMLKITVNNTPGIYPERRSAMNKTAELKSSSKDFEALGLKPEVEPWEDGVRTTGVKGEYEWWYFDGRLDDGSSLVIVFFTAPMTAQKAGYHPSLQFTLTKPDGTRISDASDWTGSYSFAKEKCRAVMGPNVFEGDLHTYHIHYENNGILADVELTGSLPSWRPGTGHIYFGSEKYFAWLPSVPEGKVTASVTCEGTTEHYTGSGYHDHNWGNTGMYFLMHHWYWGRARIGDYQAITSYITGQKKYGYEHFMIFLLAKDGNILCDKGQFVSFSQENPQYNDVTHKHFHKQLTYDYNDGTSRYRVTYEQKEIIEEFSFADSASVSGANTTAVMRFGMRLIGLDPSYIRMRGEAKIERFDGDKIVETVKSPALWEMMYFGKDADV